MICSRQTNTNSSKDEVLAPLVKSPHASEREHGTRWHLRIHSLLYCPRDLGRFDDSRRQTSNAISFQPTATTRRKEITTSLINLL